MNKQSQIKTDDSIQSSIHVLIEAARSIGFSDTELHRLRETYGLAESWHRYGWVKDSNNPPTGEDS